MESTCIENMKNRVAIIGAGAFGLQAMHYLRLMECPQYDIVGWIDDTQPLGMEINGLEVLGDISSTERLYEMDRFDSLFIAIGYNHPDFKLRLIDRFKDIIPMVNIVSPNCHVDPTAMLGENLFLYPGTIVDMGAILEDGVVLNLGAIVSHDSVIGKCTFMAPRSVVAGHSKIGECSFIGTGAVVINSIIVSDHVKLGAGTVVVSDISNSGLFCGVPSKFIR